jgi:hypothetical protein
MEQNRYIYSMPDHAPPSKALDPSFFDGRLMIDILSWDWNLRIALNPAAIGPEAPLKGLDYGRDFTLYGRVRAPRELRNKSVKLTLSPFGPKMRFGPGGLEQVGELTVQPPGSEFDFEGALMLPEDAIATTATSLASIWKHVQVHTCDYSPRDVAAYFFAAAIHPNLQAWTDAD